eukprot:9667937-Lingulodinium_polyedra.AAC.1
MARVVETGRNPTIRYLHRTQWVAVAWFHERFLDVASRLRVAYEESENACADIYIYTHPVVHCCGQMGSRV